jgi:hypothetical protein
VACSEGWLWLGGSLLAAVLWANLADFLRKPRSDAIGELVTQLRSWPFSPWMLEFLRLLYYVGVPFAALLWGHDAVVKRVLGLRQLTLPIPGGSTVDAEVAADWLDWAQGVGWAAALGIGVWALLALGWWTYRRALTTASEESAVAGTNSSGWTLFREAAYHEVHWAFYRNAPVVAWNTYWGAWGGLALVALEAALNPAWRKGLMDPQRAPAQLMRGALAIVSTVLFLRTQNLWLALAIHWGVSWGLTAFAGALPIPSTPASEQAIT